MNDDLIARVMIQLQPELAQEFANAIMENRKKLKALELIKELRIDLLMLESCESVKDYNFWRDTWDYDDLTQGEFNLLKEVLYDQKSKEIIKN